PRMKQHRVSQHRVSQHRVSLCLSATALVVAVFGSTPLGQAATRAVQKVAPPYAKTAGYAKIAGNAALLNGHKAAASGAPGTVVVVGAAGKLPASIGAVGPTGPAGPTGISGYEVVKKVDDLSDGSSGLGSSGATCPSGKKLLGGGASITTSAGAYVGTNNVI